MSDFSVSASVPAMVHLFGEYSSIFGEPGIAFAIDKKLVVKIEPSKFEFHVVDGYKLEQKKHGIFHQSIQKFSKDQFWKFTTSSQLPLLTGLGMHSSLSLAITSGLLELKKRKKAAADPELKKKRYTRAFLARSALTMENLDHPPSSPLSPAAAVSGGVVLLNDKDDGALWPVNCLNTAGSEQIRYVHASEAFSEIEFVIGYLKEQYSSKFSSTEPQPLFDEPMQKKSTPNKNLKSTTSSQQVFRTKESIPIKLRRLFSKTGFAKDNLRDMGRIIQESIEPLKQGDLVKLGSLIKKHQNLITILGAIPQELRSLVDAAEKDSYGVSIIGSYGDCIIALPKDGEAVVENINQAGGIAFITKITDDGLSLKKLKKKS
jgi:mevalonate kinase